jgi:hypothetical protein
MTKAVEFGVVRAGALVVAVLVGCSDPSEPSAGGSTVDAGGAPTVTDAAAVVDAGPVVVTDAAADAASATDAASTTDAAALDAGGASDAGRVADAGADASADAGNGLACGRYRVSDPGTGTATGPCPGTGCDGSGLVEDGRGGLIWLRFTYLPANQRQTLAEANTYCASRGMRLPTLSQAQGIAGGTNTCNAAWPAGWQTWTSTTFGTSEAYVVDVGGLALRTGIIQSSPTLCVRSGGPQ